MLALPALIQKVVVSALGWDECIADKITRLGLDNAWS